jgi:hypothetical protein
MICIGRFSTNEDANDRIVTHGQRAILLVSEAVGGANESPVREGMYVRAQVASISAFAETRAITK